MKILILTTEPLPYPGQIATGAGLRAWQLARGLESVGFSDVHLAMPINFREHASDNANIPEQSCFHRNKINEFLHNVKPDLLIVQHWGLLKDIDYVDCPLVIDLAGPHLLERFYWGESDLTETIDEKVRALRKADFVICGSQRQRYYFLPFLIKAGFEPLPSLLPVIPFSVNPDLPESSLERAFDSFVYGGMLLPWQNPEEPLKCLIEVLEQKGRGVLHFYGGPHPLGDISGGKFLSLLELLQQHRRVNIHRLIPFDELKREFSTYGVALDVMEQNFERELASTTRTLIYLWCGLPIIHHNYTDLAPYIEYYEAGWVVSYNDANALKAIIETILDNPGEVRRRSKNARNLIRDHFTWDKTVVPLARFCREPEFRKGKEQIALKSETTELQLKRAKTKLQDCQKELATLKGKKIFKLYQRFSSFSFIFIPFFFLGGYCISLLMLILFALNDIFSPFARRSKQ